jgi:tRNA threonylcarbamoyladenosine biosynthesis protein TsaB
MRDRAYNLAMETSGPIGSVTLGRGSELLETAQLPPQQRHTLDLMPVIQRLCRKHAIAPDDLGEIYVSIGPGSFTGLRIGVTTAKMLAQVLGVKVVAVPTLDVVARNAPAPHPAGQDDALPRLAVCLNVKNETAYTGLFTWNGQSWQIDGQPVLTTLAQLLSSAPRPLFLLGDPLPALPDPLPAGVTLLPAGLALARSEAVWRLGRFAADRGRFTDPLALLPLYARRPEAEELWEKRQAPEKPNPVPIT